MMKSVAALATLAMVSMAKKSRWPRLVASYDEPEEDKDDMDDMDDDMKKVDYLALVEGLETTIKYPFDWRSKRGDCKGWVIESAES